MRTSIRMVSAAAVVLVGLTAVLGKDKDAAVPPALNFTMKSLDGKPIKLSKYHGKVVLMVNVASECGLTPQYEALQGLHEKYAGKGLAVLGFPANEFGAQEPGTDKEIASFCKENYGVDFDMFSKVVVKGPDQCDLYKHLTSQEPGGAKAGDISWNFEKFLIGRNGEVIARFEPKVTPESDEVIEAIENELAKPAE